MGDFELKTSDLFNHKSLKPTKQAILTHHCVRLGFFVLILSVRLRKSKIKSGRNLEVTKIQLMDFHINWKRWEMPSAYICKYCNPGESVQTILPQFYKDCKVVAGFTHYSPLIYKMCFYFWLISKSPVNHRECF